MGKKKKRLTPLLLAGALLLNMAGCSGTAAAGEHMRLMVWSSSEDQSKDSGAWLQTCCDNFAKQHPEWDITFVYGVAAEDTAATSIVQDPEAGADVFMYPNDRLTDLTEAQAVAKIGGKYEQQIRSDCSPAAADSVTLDGYLYGAPYTTNTWFMYYDKSIFSDEDIKSLDKMVEKGVVSFPFTNSWYLPAFYFGNGCTLFGDGTQEELGADFGGDNAVAVTDYLIDLLANPNFVVDSDGSGIAGLRDGSINAIFSGSWDYASVKDILGDNLGAVALPTYNLNGEQKQMYAFAGSKAIGVNAHSDNMVAAVELAIYLSSAESQKLRYDLRSVIPSSVELESDPVIANDPVFQAQSDTFNRTSILQPFVPKMANCWTPVELMGKAIRNGDTTHENAEEQTVAMNASMNSDGIS